MHYYLNMINIDVENRIVCRNILKRSLINDTDLQEIIFEPNKYTT